MKINAKEMTKEFKVFLKNTFPELHRDFEKGDERALECAKYLNFGYSFKANQLQTVEQNLYKIEAYKERKSELGDIPELDAIIQAEGHEKFQLLLKEYSHISHARLYGIEEAS